MITATTTYKIACDWCAVQGEPFHESEPADPLPYGWTKVGTISGYRDREIISDGRRFMYPVPYALLCVKCLERYDAAVERARKAATK